MNKLKTGITAATVLIIIAEIILVFMMRRPSAMPSTNDLSASRWSYYGDKNPKAAIISVSAAIKDQNGQEIVDSMTPELRKNWEFNWQRMMQKQNKTLAQLMTEYAPRTLSRDVNIRFLKQTFLGDDRALVIIKVSAQGKQQTVSLVMKKINNEWKVDFFQ